MFTHILIILLIQSVIGTDLVPVLLWGSENLKTMPALTKMAGDTFRNNILNNGNKNDLTLIFAEENLSIEDFVWKNDIGFGSFGKLDNITSDLSISSRFFPAVEDPIEALLESQEWEHLPITADLNRAITSKKHSSFFIIHLNDADEKEDRPEMLQRHDSIIAATYNAAKQSYGKILVIYTGYHASWVPTQQYIRHTRSLLATTESNGTFINANNLTYLYTSQSPVLTTHNDTAELENIIEATASETSIGRGVIMTVTYLINETNLNLIYNYPETTTGYWTLTDITIMRTGQENVTVTAKDISAPYAWSYHCTDVLFQSKDDMYSITYKDFQTEVLPKEQDRFGKSYDCVYFFSIPVLSGILVTALFALIMTFGLTMLMDIKTMDRFDDPKGKTITINTSE